MEITMLNLAASGLRSQQTRLDLVGHNLANLGTPGYRSFRAELVDLPTNPHTFGLTAPTTLTLADAPTEGAVVARTLQPSIPGAIVATGEPLDIALPARVYLAVQLPNGQTAYTRNGRLTVNSEGTIQAGDFPLLGNLRVPPEAGTPIVDHQGRLLAIGPEGEQVLGTLPIVQFRNPEELEPLGRGVLLPTQDSGAPEQFTPDELNTLAPQALEASNVQVERELTLLMRAQRAYQANVQVVRTWDELAAQTVREIVQS